MRVKIFTLAAVARDSRKYLITLCLNLVLMAIKSHCSNLQPKD